jgi:ribonuclease HI
METKIKIFADGGSRGNPGPSASAFVVLKKKEVVHSESKLLGQSTNNKAEYTAVILALKWLVKNKKNISESEINFFLDSELVVKQLTGLYKIKNSALKVLASTAKSLENKLGMQVKYFYIKRERNKLADALVNKSLDENL